MSDIETCALDSAQRDVLLAEFERRNACSGFGTTAFKLPERLQILEWEEILTGCTDCHGATTEGRVCTAAKAVLYLVSEMKNEETEL